MISTYINKIIQNPKFLKLKKVIENNSYHDKESVYNHLIKTKNIAQDKIKGGFIKNPKAKGSFLQFANEDLDEFKKGDLMILTALLHDIGKLKSKLITNSQGVTSCPNHEYLGSTMVYQLIKFSSEIMKLIAHVIRNHDAFGDSYFKSKKNWSLERLIADIKSKSKNLHKEILFNIYCDCYTAKPAKYRVEMIAKIFNQPIFYE